MAAPSQEVAVTLECPPDDDVFCISTLAPARKTTAADAGTALASERIDRCIALNNDIFVSFCPDSTDACAAITFRFWRSGCRSRLIFAGGDFLSLVIRLVRNGQPTISIVLVQTCLTRDTSAVQNILAVQLNFVSPLPLRSCPILPIGSSFFRPHRYCCHPV